MGLIVGYRDVTANVSYWLQFSIGNVEFYAEGIEAGEHGETRKTAEEILLAVHSLQSKGITPKIRRFVHYPEHWREHPDKEEEISVERLEEIVSTGEQIPQLVSPVVESTSIC